MSAEDIPEIKEAEGLLRKAEANFPSVESSQLFKEAFEVLDDFLEAEDRGEIISIFVKNLKHSYTRSFIEQLSKIDARDFDKYVHYLIVLLLHSGDEFKRIESSDPQLYAAFKESQIRFRLQLDEVIEILQQQR